VKIVRGTINNNTIITIHKNGTSPPGPSRQSPMGLASTKTNVQKPMLA